MFENNEVNITKLPSIESIEFNLISRNYLKVLILNTILIFIILFGALSIFILLNESEFTMKYSWLGFTGLAFIFIFRLTIIILAFNKRAYAIRNHDVIYKEGLITHKVTTVPFIRVQHVEISRGFIAIKFNLATLHIYTAGESGDDLSIAGLPYDIAQKLNTYLTSKINA